MIHGQLLRILFGEGRSLRAGLSCFAPSPGKPGLGPSGFDPYRGRPAGLTPLSRPPWSRSRCRAAATVAGHRPRSSSPARPRWVVLPDPIPFTSAEGRTVSMPCVMPAPARAPPGGEEILPSTTTARGRASPPPGRYPRRVARLWRRHPTPRRRRSPSQPCPSITAPPAQRPSKSVPGAAGIRADFTGPGTYGRRRVVPPPTPLPRVSPNGPPLGHLTSRTGDPGTQNSRVGAGESAPRLTSRAIRSAKPRRCRRNAARPRLNSPILPSDSLRPKAIVSRYTPLDRYTEARSHAAKRFAPEHRPHVAPRACGVAPQPSVCVHRIH